MALTDVLNRLEKKFKPEILGLESVTDVRQRLNEYALEEKTRIEALDIAKQDLAYQAWCKYRVYDDAYDYLLSLPEATTTEGEGSVKLADRKTLLGAFAAARDDAANDFADILAPSTTATPKNQGTVSVPIEVVW